MLPLNPRLYNDLYTLLRDELGQGVAIFVLEALEPAWPPSMSIILYVMLLRGLRLLGDDENLHDPDYSIIIHKVQTYWVGRPSAL